MNLGRPLVTPLPAHIAECSNSKQLRSFVEIYFLYENKCLILTEIIIHKDLFHLRRLVLSEVISRHCAYGVNSVVDVDAVADAD